MFTTNGTYPWSFLTPIFYNGQSSHGGDRKTFEVMNCSNNDLRLTLNTIVAKIYLKQNL